MDSLRNLKDVFLNVNSAAEYAAGYTDYLGALLKKLDYGSIENMINVIEAAYSQDRAIYFIGNGGSASTSSHWANDLTIGTRVKGMRPFRALSLTDNVSILTALGNDRSYDDIFVGQMEGMFQPNDVLVAISASGNSVNVLRAVKYARSLGGVTLALVGFDGGQLKPLCHVCVHVKTEKGEYGPVEDIHLVLDHLITSYIKSKMMNLSPMQEAVCTEND